MNKDDLRLFLAEWLMHCGADWCCPFYPPVHQWYISSAYHCKTLPNYFDSREKDRLEFKLTPEALAFLKGEDHG